MYILVVVLVPPEQCERLNFPAPGRVDAIRRLNDSNSAKNRAGDPSFPIPEPKN